MKAILREHFQAEIAKAQLALEAKKFADAWTALQRAHILGQMYPVPHAIAHWEMLKLAWLQRDIKEIHGQFWQTVWAAPLTLLFGRKRSLRDGKVNLENTQRMSIPDDLLEILKQ
ncbi:DUF3703 domain-containing protein [Gloeocapsopsis crepidinum LEGE 06123]|uniref:DUF3703 domain-containing protein n=1 Tax=Gloeocapsopsis crepidinum LEGE 06123 TaxID=588587 RepID=A0ABR9UTC2_9CHRO|nr:DUF3703 domain-containing protein [Gloeocapsopsis crepidinum]MBE9191550.1 DUF3703 domain-containing protein [Gloeocapsopsis crepidinum LEGE 06123]